MKKITAISIITLLLAMGCSNANYITVKHVKPVNKNRFYNPKKDKRKKRTKYVKVKILKKSPEVKAKSSKQEKADRPNKEEEMMPDTIPSVLPDSTGFFF